MSIIEEIEQADIEQRDSVPELRQWVRQLAERVKTLEAELKRERNWQLEIAEY